MKTGEEKHNSLENQEWLTLETTLGDSVATD